jgi:site-specific DNA-methyltransferase (adenine-specific)
MAVQLDKTMSKIQDSEKIIASRNRTLFLDEAEKKRLSEKLVFADDLSEVLNRTICGNVCSILPKLPKNSVDLLFLDPPYNLDKTFHQNSFRAKSIAGYAEWLENLLEKTVPLLKPTASVYICGDWRSCAAIQLAAEKFFIVRNRITWEREKGRGANKNWKNCAEDIWFCTVSDDFFFNAEAVKLKRKVIAPYRENGKPKDWSEESDGNFRLTAPSNLWTDISIPFWSMPENTEHPTQKPEKLLAKLILASSRENDVILDPFLGSGTTSVTAKKLNRQFIGIELEEYFCQLAEKRLELAETDKKIQGYTDGVFWERNSVKFKSEKVKK